MTIAMRVHALPIGRVGASSASRCFRADRVERRARRYIERAPIRAAEGQAAGPLGNFEHARRLSIAVVDPDLTTGDVHIAGSIRDDRRAATLGEDRAAELAVRLECHAVSSAVILARQ